MIRPRRDLGPAVAVAIQQHSASAAVAGRDGMNDGYRPGRRNRDRADGSLHFTLQLGFLLLKHAHRFLRHRAAPDGAHRH